MDYLKVIKNNQQKIIVSLILVLGSFSGGYYTCQYTAIENEEVCIKSTEPIITPETGETSTDVLSFSTSTIETAKCNSYVELSGAVLNPSVFCVQPSDRIVDIISKGGGFLSDKYAKRYVEQKLNLASYVVNGDKIYIPYEDDVVCKKKEDWSSPANVPLKTQVSQSELDFKAEDNSTTTTSTQGVCVNINTASLEELDTLPGIGASTASKIINGRPYVNKEDLLNISGIGDSIFEKIKDLVCI